MLSNAFALAPPVASGLRFSRQAAKQPSRRRRGRPRARPATGLRAVAHSSWTASGSNHCLAKGLLKLARGLTIRTSNVGSLCCDTALAAAAYRRGELQCGPLKLSVTTCCSVHRSLSRESTMNLLPRTSPETEGPWCSVHGSQR